MLHIVKLPDRTPEQAATLDGIFAHASDAMRLLSCNSEHRNATLAAHALDLYVAAARIAAMSPDGAVDMGAWERHLSHVCEAHTHAALFLLATSTPDNEGGAVALAAEGLDVVRQFFDQK